MKCNRCGRNRSTSTGCPDKCPVRCRHCGERVKAHLDDHPKLCCDCFDLSCGMSLEAVNEERAAKGKPPITEPWKSND